MALARNTIVAVTDLRTRIRFEAMDPATDPAGNTRASGELRFSTTEVDEALKDQLVEMSNMIAAFTPGDSLLYEDVTVSDGTATLPDELGLTTAAVYKVELLNANSEIDAVLDYVPYGLLKEWPARTVYSLVGGTAPGTSSLKIEIRPKYEGSQIVRVWYVAPPIVWGAAADALPSTDRWRELLCLGAAMKLTSPMGDSSDDQRVRYARLWDGFEAWSDRVRGPRKARMRSW
jgi:hypothetical protein